MAFPWRNRWETGQRFIGELVQLTTNDVPRLIRRLQDAPSLQEGIKIGIEVLSSGGLGPSPQHLTGRPVASVSAPTAQRARRVLYAPNLGGRTDPGEVVWAWVTYEDDPGQGRDRPVLVVGRDHHILLGLMLSSLAPHCDDPNWVGIGPGGWDDAGRESWVRLDRVLDVPEEGIRREGAVLERDTFELVAARLRAEHSWS
ncbi:MAG: type II toxin-antitoxin system PemK/MazF family toxin [Mycobacterium sp.]